MKSIENRTYATRSNLMADENAKCKLYGARVVVHYRETLSAAARCGACAATFVYELPTTARCSNCVWDVTHARTATI